jgi:hypothetical protein
MDLRQSPRSRDPQWRQAHPSKALLVISARFTQLAAYHSLAWYIRLGFMTV